jgi:hypothetical protein
MQVRGQRRGFVDLRVDLLEVDFSRDGVERAAAQAPPQQPGVRLDGRQPLQEAVNKPRERSGLRLVL